MKRRTFLGLSLGAAPSVLLAQGPSLVGTSVPVQVSAGVDRFKEPCRLGDNSTIDRKVSSADTAGQLFIIENHAQGRFGPPRHVHHEQDEWFHVVSGVVVLEVGDQKYRLLPGDSVLAPRGVPHVWAQVAPEGGRLLIAFQPSGKMEAFFGELGKLGGFPPPAQARELFEKHGMTIVGPPLNPG
jgi:quercetin dioxygenase-like cupin family protein